MNNKLFWYKVRQKGGLLCACASTGYDSCPICNKQNKTTAVKVVETRKLSMGTILDTVGPVAVQSALFSL